MFLQVLTISVKRLPGLYVLSLRLRGWTLMALLVYYSLGFKQRVTPQLWNFDFNLRSDRFHQQLALPSSLPLCSPKSVMDFDPWPLQLTLPPRHQLMVFGVVALRFFSIAAFDSLLGPSSQQLGYWMQTRTMWLAQRNFLSRFWVTDLQSLMGHMPTLVFLQSLHHR